MRIAAIASAVVLVGFGVYIPLSAALQGKGGAALVGVPLLALWIGTFWFIVALSRPPVWWPRSGFPTKG